MKLGKTIASVRLERGFKQIDLAERSQISKSYLSEIENDTKRPDMEILERICVALNVPIQILVLKATMEEDITDPDKMRLVREIKPLLNELTMALYPDVVEPKSELPAPVTN
ncbi:helix-turn-helix domain-containing protein [Chryseolinea lacunae]|uniref:Helix-turn-helix transcriptional regulator n=1 Tax=Chryseolinea lacunae TaxID=2801331 RepID=A0ABS1KZE0_9BACT|nr:helix-turn-helix transcriptional regulator [Chryseolinea lacunae]MBL0744841.1 helix-turn-helix transcriptional regulator [Chryseolinea lacunae]